MFLLQGKLLKVCVTRFNNFCFLFSINTGTLPSSQFLFYRKKAGLGKYVQTSNSNRTWPGPGQQFWTRLQRSGLKAALLIRIIFLDPNKLWSASDLVCDGPDVLEWEGLELVLLEKVVEVLLQHLEDEAGVVLVGEALVGPHKVELVSILLAEK